MDTILCTCNKEAKLLTVKKEGPNNGKKFYKCAKDGCKFFKWENDCVYDPKRFKTGSCYRCGRFGCFIEDCDEMYDWFGNKIPDDYEKFFA
jgi:hypothetical protein